MYRRDSLEQFRIEKDLIGSRRQLRLPFAFERLIGGGRDVFARDAEHPLDAIEHPARAFHRGNRVVEGRRFGVRGDGVDLAAQFDDRRVECSGKMFGRHPIPRRHAAVRTGPRAGQRIVGHEGECYRDSSGRCAWGDRAGRGTANIASHPAQTKYTSSAVRRMLRTYASVEQ